MGYFFCGLAGVVLGALIASGIFLYLLQRRADRDLIERRLRAILQYRDCLGGLTSALADRAGDPQVTRQVWKNVAEFCREFHVTGWFLPAADRESLGKIVGEMEREVRACELNGGNASIPRLLDRADKIDRLLQRAVKRQLAEHRKLRFLPERRSRAREEEEE